MARQGLPRCQALSRIGLVLGLVLLMVGFVVRDVSARALVQQDYAALGLWVAGLALVAAGLALNFRMLVRAVTARRTAEGVNFGAAVVLAVVLAALLCYISTRRFARLDWTSGRTYTLHSKTRNILRGLDRDVEVTLLFIAGDDPLADRALESTLDMLEEFRSLSSHVSVQQVNWAAPDDQAKWDRLRARLGEENVPQRAVVFVTDDSHEIVAVQNLVRRSFEGIEFTGEDAFAGALTKLMEMKKATVYFLTGHGERPIEPAQPALAPQERAGILDTPAYSFERVAKALRNDHYEVKTLNLAGEGAVPGDCDVLVIAGPRAPFTEAEQQALEVYLNERNGNVLLLVDPDIVAGRKSNVNELLQQHGIRARTDAVGITTIQTPLGMMHSEEVPVMADGVADHPVTSGLANYTVTLQQPCPLEVGPSAPGAPQQVRELLQATLSYGETRYMPAEEEALRYEPGQDVAQPITVVAVAAPAEPPPGLPVPPLAGALGPKLLVVGSSLSFVNAAVDLRPANLFLIQNGINWMAGRMHMLGIPGRTMEFNPATVSDSQLLAARYLFIGGLPACIVALGFVVWLVRRR